MYEHDRLALAFIEIGDFDIAVMKTWHERSVVYGTGLRP